MTRIASVYLKFSDCEEVCDIPIDFATPEQIWK